MLETHAPEIVIYLAGADPYEDDQLGSLRLTKAGLAERDRLVFGEARLRGVPVAAVLAGGYARRTSDVVEIHTGTVREALDCWGPLVPRPARRATARDERRRTPDPSA
jgi:acetoin utilization deacetylase AcuC-like enzyme